MTIYNDDWQTTYVDIPRWLPDTYHNPWIDLHLYFLRYPIRKWVIRIAAKLTPTQSLLSRSDDYQDAALDIPDDRHDDAAYLRMMALALTLELITRAYKQPGTGSERYRVRYQWRH